MIAVSLNVGGGVRLIKPAKLCMCTQNTTDTTWTDARRRAMKDKSADHFLCYHTDTGGSTIFFTKRSKFKGSSQHKVGGEWFEIKLGKISRMLVKYEVLPIPNVIFVC